jgi:putative peptide zinc metalloprotease protein
MTQSVLAENWYRVATMRPRLRSHVQLHRQRHRGQLWYVMQDHQSGRFFRISPATNLMLCMMDGRRTTEAIWDLVGERYGAERPTQDEVVRLLIQLHQSDLLNAEFVPDMAELERRATRQRRRDLIARIRSPLALRFSLFDPERFLSATLPLVRPLFSRTGLALWLALVIAGVVLAAQHWTELTADAVDRVLSAENIVLLLLTYPVVKALHELGHAYATKMGGGEVHEIGIMLLVLLPVPYVDASASSAFRERWRRALVGGAGIMVEMALASLALVAWLQVGPGLLRAALFNVMLVGGVSTVLFNGNPLLRFDGYYVLCDLIGIPNLDTRARRYLLYLLQRYLLRLDQAESPVQGPGERGWFIVYGVTSFLYRVSVTFAIALFIASRFFIIGVLIAIMSVVQMFGLPTWQALRYVFRSPQLRHRRAHALLASGAAVLAVAALMYLVPVPYATVAQGVVWVPEGDIVRAGGDGFVTAVFAQPGDEIDAGRPILRIEDPIAASQVEVKRAQLAVLSNRFTAVNLIDLVQARLVREQLRRAAANLEQAQARQRDLVAVASHSGRVVIPDAAKLIGRFVHKGDLLGYVIGPSDIGIHVVIPQDEIDPVRQRVRDVSVRLTETIDQVYPARIGLEPPAALERVPTPALTNLGGGPIMLDPSQPDRLRPLEKFYEIELKLGGTPIERIGGRAYARFDLGHEPIGWRIVRALRQLFLHAIHV